MCVSWLEDVHPGVVIVLVVCSLAPRLALLDLPSSKCSCRDGWLPSTGRGPSGVTQRLRMNWGLMSDWKF